MIKCINAQNIRLYNIIGTVLCYTATSERWDCILQHITTVTVTLFLSGIFYSGHIVGTHSIYFVILFLDEMCVIIVEYVFTCSNKISIENENSLCLIKLTLLAISLKSALTKC